MIFGSDQLKPAPCEQSIPLTIIGPTLLILNIKSVEFREIQCKTFYDNETSPIELGKNFFGLADRKSKYSPLETKQRILPAAQLSQKE